MQGCVKAYLHVCLDTGVWIVTEDELDHCWGWDFDSDVEGCHAVDVLAVDVHLTPLEHLYCFLIALVFYVVEKELCAHIAEFLGSHLYVLYIGAKFCIELMFTMESR